MITNKAFKKYCESLHDTLPPECGFALVVFAIQPKDEDGHTPVSISLGGSAHFPDLESRLVIAEALHKVATDLEEDA